MYPNDENEATEGDYTHEISLMEVPFKPTVLLIQSIQWNIYIDSVRNQNVIFEATHKYLLIWHNFLEGKAAAIWQFLL